jgi:hypothetical protein
VVSPCSSVFDQSTSRKGQHLDATHFDSLLRSLARGPARRDISRTLAAFALGGALVQFRLVETEARKRKRKNKKRCKGGKKKCGRGCCGPASQCVVGVCFCTGNEPPAGPKCVDVAETLIEIIAEQTGIDPGIIGANPEEPLEEQVTIDEDIRLTIDELIQKTFGVEEEVPYYTEGITAAAEVIREELATKG